MAFYGTAAQVVALVPRYATAGGAFDATTRPTLTAVETWLQQVSDMCNSMLAAEGFDTPVTETTVASALAGFVTQEVAAICEGVNGSGRFGPTTKAPGRSRFQMILDDVEAFITASAVGFERLGAAREYNPASGIGYRDSDVSGTATAPIFQVKSFGNTFADWDAA